jgi:hypothetical protein
MSAARSWQGKHAAVLLQHCCAASHPLAQMLHHIHPHPHITCFCKCCRGFLQLHPRQRAKIVDVLAANLSMLCSSALGLLSSQEAVQPEAVLLHKNGLRMLVNLLHVIAMQADKDAQQVQGGKNAAKPKAAGKWRHSCGRCRALQAQVLHCCQGHCILHSAACTLHNSACQQAFHAQVAVATHDCLCLQAVVAKQQQQLMKTAGTGSIAGSVCC